MFVFSPLRAQQLFTKRLYQPTTYNSLGDCSHTYTNYPITVTTGCVVTWCFSDRASWTDYILITNLMHRLLFIHKILFSSTCFEPQVLIFRRIQLYTCTCSIWQCHSLREFVVACRYTAWVRTDCRRKVVGGCLKRPTNNLPPTVSSHSSCVPTDNHELP